MYATCQAAIDGCPPRLCRYAGQIEPGFWECPNCGHLNYTTETDR